MAKNVTVKQKTCNSCKRPNVLTVEVSENVNLCSKCLLIMKKTEGQIKYHQRKEIKIEQSSLF